MGLNGGLFWAGFAKKVAVQTGQSKNSIKSTLVSLGKKFGILNRGEILYAASSLLKIPVAVRLPPQVDAEFDELELRVMRESARVLIPSAGFYNGFIVEVARRTNYSKFHLSGKVRRGILEKTGTRNLGQAVTYFIAHGLIQPREVTSASDIRRVPALEAIIKAMQREPYKL